LYLLLLLTMMMLSTATCRRRDMSAIFAVFTVLLIVDVVPRSVAVRRYRNGAPPDTTGFFFGKREPMPGAIMRMHPNANNLLFGKRAPGPENVAASDEHVATPADAFGVVDDGFASAAAGGSSAVDEICRAVRPVCASKWSSSPVHEESESNVY
jgi:hypothetical protein